MSEPLPEIYLARHGETAWTISRQHTGRSDIPLTARGERNARQPGRAVAWNGLRQGPGQPARSVRLGPPSWPASARSPRSIPIWRNGIMAGMTA